MAKRTIRVRIWRHKTTEGGYRISHFGDEVDLPKAEVERGDREGVFNPTPIPETRSADVDQKLAGIISRIPLPTGADESDSAPLNHDIRPALERSVAHVLALHDDESSIEDEPETEQSPATGDEQPADSDAASTEQSPATGDDPAPAVELKRPAKAAAHEKWVDYVHQATGRPADELAELSKDELQAIKV